MAGTRITDVTTVAVPVRDQDEALAFYVDVLGFGKRLDAPFGGGRWVTVAPAGASTSIALVAGDRTGVDTGIRLATADAAADHEHLRAAGVDVDAEILRYPGVPAMFTFRDADGNTLVVVEIMAT
ncbi:VOC family protein [Pseudonocardia adelaidensis]|uniref:VOC family protein n=1 Tax=Pseudonocardia adelaidensis TaxID=648754 RepID=A0ABP9NHH3_9PSEU